MQQDLINTINDILDDPSVKNNPDFLLYLTGYAQFFGTDYDPWCNNEAWNINSWVFAPTPYLSVELRTAFNDRVSAVNTLYKNTIASNFANKARYIDLDAGFSGHRFCEPGATHEDQLNTDTNFHGVYLWNLNWPWQVANAAPPAGQDPNNVTAQEAQNLFNGQGVTAWSGGSGSGGGGNEPSNGWRLRPFHPRTSGYTSIKNAILAQLKTDGLPKAGSASSPSPSPSASPSPPAYAPGTCSFHLDEWQSCADDSSNLYATIKMYDNNKNVIGQTNVDPTKNPLGDPINNSDPLNFQSKLPYPLQVTGEHENDYVQFNYNGLAFKSRDGQCSVGGWDPRDGPVCGLRPGNQNAVSPVPAPCIGGQRLTLITAQSNGLLVPVLDLRRREHPLYVTFSRHVQYLLPSLFTPRIFLDFLEAFLVYDIAVLFCRSYGSIEATILRINAGRALGIWPNFSTRLFVGKPRDFTAFHKLQRYPSALRCPWSIRPIDSATRDPILLR